MRHNIMSHRMHLPASHYLDLLIRGRGKVYKWEFELQIPGIMLVNPFSSHKKFKFPTFLSPLV